MSSNNKYSGNQRDRDKQELDVRRKLMATEKKAKDTKDKGKDAKKK